MSKKLLNGKPNIILNIHTKYKDKWTEESSLKKEPY